MDLAAGSNDDDFLVRGSGPLALVVRSVDAASCHGVHKCGMTGRPWRQDLPRLPLAYRT
jgi:hypothetical protein